MKRLAAVLLAAMLSAAGCAPPEESPTEVPLEQLQPGPIRHAALPDTLVARIDAFLPVFADVDPTPREKWLEDFRRDAHPEREVAIWERIAAALAKFEAAERPSRALKQEAYGLLLLRSASDDATVLQRAELKALSREQAIRVLAMYAAPAQPIRVKPD